ncbi:M48 family metallopeptidase [Candidatus Pacearchaeota archaeon]|nr:M48 family metallopeptidase [Candidatus Pacearchaeota archaeon]
MVERLHFEDQIFKNKLKSLILLAAIVVFFIVLGYVISLLLDPSYFFMIMIVSIIISLAYIWFGYYNSDKIALASVNAKPASHTEHRMLHHAVESIAIASGLPKPRVYVMKSEQINAFASGRDPRHAVICVTTDALDKLSKQELEGVIAHEMAHIANFDIRFMTLTTILVGIVSIAAELFLRSLWFSSDREGGRGNIMLLVIGLILAILAPIAVQLVQLAISRRREFTADATGVKFTRYPQGLANALKKIRDDHDAIGSKDQHHYAKALAPLFIGNPFKVESILSTHPPINERIRRLEAM